MGSTKMEVGCPIAFIDTNVFLDYFLQRDHYEECKDVLTYCWDFKLQGWHSSKTILDVYYFIRKEESHEFAMDCLSQMTRQIRTANTAGGDIMLVQYADQNGEEIIDFEDAVQIQTASKTGARYIITSDKEGFKTAKQQVLTPFEFVRDVGQYLEDPFVSYRV